ncbi:MAG: SCO family protein [Proteobacteria bacterium]|nr:SCO family protein [Pseudomonadota bacterium]
MAGTELIPSQSIGDFSLQDAYGVPFTKANLLGHWTVLSFGFTHCPDICPVTLASFRDELNALPPGLTQGLCPKISYLNSACHRHSRRSEDFCHSL